MILSVVIPALNEAENIPATVGELIGVLGGVGLTDDYEIIVVDDHSSDDTFGAVMRIASDKVKCISLSRRCGSHTAIRAGIAEARGDAVLCISADGQDDPAVLAQMIEKWHSGAHTVWALRISRDEGISQKIFALTFYQVIKWLGTSSSEKIDMARADFFLLDRLVVDALTACPERGASLFGLIEWVGFTTDFVEYNRRQRQAGKPKWNFWGRMGLAWDWITGFSGIPLRLIALFGGVVALIGFIYALFLVYYRLTHEAMPLGFAETVVLMLVVSGIQMIMLGVIGEYLWRNIELTRQRPNYFIMRRTQK